MRRVARLSVSRDARIVLIDEVDLGRRHAQAFDDLALGLGLAELEARAAA